MRQITICTLLALSVPAWAQWEKIVTPSVPRLPDGKTNLTAPAPRSLDGKPDFSGIWVTTPGYTGNMAKDLKPGEVSFRPWAETLYKHRVETESREDPQARCVLSGVPREHVVPYPFKILNTNGEIVILYEALHSYRQIFMDGRPLPKNPNPAWMGYSIGHWDKDTFIVETIGQNGRTWLDMKGLPGTEALRVTERFSRPRIGHMDIDVTIDDPEAYTRPWNVRLSWRLLPDTDLIESICEENNRDPAHMVGK